jgi:hypothetical protein
MGYMVTPFHLSRLLLPDYKSLITSMDILIEVGGHSISPPGITGLWADVYAAFFDLFQHTFRNVSRLRLTVLLRPWHSASMFTNATLDGLLGPWERLASSREWIYLDLCAPDVWYDLLKVRADAQKIWTASRTQRRQDTHGPYLIVI